MVFDHIGFNVTDFRSAGQFFVDALAPRGMITARPDCVQLLRGVRHRAPTAATSKRSAKRSRANSEG